MNICSYGCVEEATYQLKNGKWCCCDSCNKCKGQREKNKKGNTGKIFSNERKEKIRQGNLGKKFTEERKEKLRKTTKKQWDDPNSLFNSNEFRYKLKYQRVGKFHTKESRNKMSSSHKGIRSKHKGKTYLELYGEEKTTLIKNKISSKRIGKTYEEIMGKDKSIKLKEKKRQKMLNGQGAIMRSKIKKISNEEIKLRNMVKELYSSAEFQYPVFNYALDIAIPEYKISIEFDGWYHFYNQEAKDYHIFRQKRIEEKGWKFLRYSIYDKFPTIEKIKEDIFRII